MVGEEGSIDACYADGSLIVLGSQSCPVQTLCTPGYGGSQCQTYDVAQKLSYVFF